MDVKGQFAHCSQWSRGVGYRRITMNDLFEKIVDLEIAFILKKKQNQANDIEQFFLSRLLN